MTSNSQVMTTARIRAEMADTTPPCSTQPDLFFGPDEELPKGRELRERSARTLCLSCPVRELCLRLAGLEGPAYGIWGGFAAEEISAQKREAV